MHITRRSAIQRTAALSLGTALSLPKLRAADTDAAHRKLRVAVVALGRGFSHVTAARHGGAIGEVRYARSMYYNARAAIGQGALKADPGIDMDLWQGPVTSDGDITPFVHYDWHWLWHWGNGELGNNGIHFLDILRWGLKVEYPERVTYNGN